MNSRETNLVQLRPQISSAKITNNMSGDEYFQNTTLRQVVKLQNGLILAVFQNYLNKFKNGFYEYSIEKKMEYVENTIQKNTKFRNSLKGMIIGQFTLEEYQVYIKNSSALNKRMMQLVIERLKDQIQLFDEELTHN